MVFLVILVNDKIVQCQMDFKLTSRNKNYGLVPVKLASKLRSNLSGVDIG